MFNQVGLSLDYNLSYFGVTYGIEKTMRGLEAVTGLKLGICQYVVQVIESV